MKKRIALGLLLVTTAASAQTLERRRFDYKQLEKETYPACDTSAELQLDNAFTLLQQNNSKSALSITKQLMDDKHDCPAVFEYYGYSLFRTGEWMAGVQILDSAIDRFGSSPDLIIRKAYMSLEMAQSGTGMRTVDGNAIYLPAAKQLPYDEAQFVRENYASALDDLHYITDNYEDRYDDIATMAGVYRSLNDFESSNKELEKLLGIFGYKDNALFSMAENNLSMHKLDEAEIILNKLLEKYTREPIVYQKLAELYQAKNDSVQLQLCRDKADFYSLTPKESDLEFNQQNMELLLYYYQNDAKPKDKMKRLNKLAKKGPTAYTIDVCLAILKMHTNHGTGIEERATELLSEIGKEALPKTQALFSSESISTCTITNLANVMATIKDTSSWDLLVNYLPQMAYLPMTLIPPDVPAMLIKFDEEKGSRELLLFIKNYLLKESSTTDEAMTSMGIFGQYIYFDPLKKVDKDKLTAIAKKLNYSDAQLNTLLKKVYEKG